jgi:serine/threonine protein phosphatase PrpC
LSREPQFLRITASGATDIGGQREHNEDTVLLRSDLSLYIVADGAGGHNAGNVASALATSALANAYESGAARFVSGGEGDLLGPALARRLAAAVHHANREIVEIAKSSNKYRGMGTTVVAACFSPKTCELPVAHVGDSRCYRLRGGDLEQLTHDHSLFNDVLEMRPDIDNATLSRLPRHVITRALGMEESVRVSVRTHVVALDDRFLLCSDGVTDALDDDAIAHLLGLAGLTPENIVRELIDAALEAGADDNIAALVLFAGKGDAGAVQPTRRKNPVVPPPVAVAHARESRGSAPEIIIMNVEELDEDDPTITVVPSYGASATLTDAFAGLRMRKPQRSNPGD